MRFQIKQWCDEEHHEELWVEFYLGEELHKREDHAESDLHQRGGDARYEAADERRQQHGRQDAQDEGEGLQGVLSMAVGRLPHGSWHIGSQHAGWCGATDDQMCAFTRIVYLV